VQGRDLILSDDRLAASRAFANKIWNAARFVLMNLEGAPQPLPFVELSKLDLAERWIVSRLDTAIRDVTAAIDAYEFNRAALIVYQFVWHEFCDWYIELAKEPLKAGGERQAAARYVLVTCFDRMLRILHPFMPFISEEIWQTLRPYFGEANLSDHLAVARWPAPSAVDPLSVADAIAMALCVDVTEVLNSRRSFLGFHPGQGLDAQLRPLPRGIVDELNYYRERDGKALEAFASGPQVNAGISPAQVQEFVQGFEQWRAYAQVMTKAKLDVFVGTERPTRVITWTLKECEILIKSPDGFDFEKERLAIIERIKKTRKLVEQRRNRMENTDFQQKATEEAKQETADNLFRLELEERSLMRVLSSLGTGRVADLEP